MHLHNWLKIFTIMFIKCVHSEKISTGAVGSYMARKSLQIYKWYANNLIKLRTSINVADDIFLRISLCLQYEYNMIDMV